MPIDPATLDADPVRQLGRWIEEAADAGVALPNAFALATADADGVPSVRFVLAHGLDGEGLRFYTNRASRKGRELAVNPWAAAAAWWPALDRQARVSGPIRRFVSPNAPTLKSQSGRAARASRFLATNAFASGGHDWSYTGAPSTTAS